LLNTNWRAGAGAPSATHCPAPAALTTRPGTRNSAMPSMFNFNPRSISSAAAVDAGLVHGLALGQQAIEDHRVEELF